MFTAEQVRKAQSSTFSDTLKFLHENRKDCQTDSVVFVSMQRMMKMAIKSAATEIYWYERISRMHWQELERLGFTLTQEDGAVKISWQNKN